MNPKVGLFSALLSVALFSANPTSEAMVVSGQFAGHSVTLSTNPLVAQAISSLIWDGQEFVRSDIGGVLDTGLEMQSTISFNGHGGCYQAVEGGSRDDEGQSSSIVLEESTYGNTIWTKSSLAYWLKVGQSPTFPRCGQMSRSQWDHTVAENTTNIWEGVFYKRATLGYRGMPNVIESITAFSVPSYYDSVLFVALTLYTPGGFAPRHAVNLESGDLEEIDWGGGGYPTYNELDYDPITDQFIDDPIILSTEDENYAIAFYSPDAVNRYPGPWWGTSEYGGWSYGYGRWYMGGFGSKIALFFGAGHTAPAMYDFRQFVVFGTLQDVEDTIIYLHETERPAISRGYAAYLINSAFGGGFDPPLVPSFVDVPIDHPYYADIEQWKSESITTGCQYGWYCPDQKLTRAAALTFLLRKLGYSPMTCNPELYEDVPSFFPLCGWITKAHSFGLDTPCSSDLFCPNDPVTLQELSDLIWKGRFLE